MKIIFLIIQVDIKAFLKIRVSIRVGYPNKL